MKYRYILLILFFEIFKIFILRFTSGYHVFLVWYVGPIILGATIGLILYRTIAVKSFINRAGEDSHVLRIAVFLYSVIWVALEIFISKFCVFIKASNDISVLSSCFKLGQLGRTFFVSIILVLIMKSEIPSATTKVRVEPRNKGLSFDFTRDWSLLILISLF